MDVSVVQGDLLDQDVDVIVNAWNRNIIPWWLLLPQGVSGAIKRRGGTNPFKELAKHGSIPLGGAVLTSAGRLPFKAIIHVAGINMLWRASECSIRKAVKNAMTLAHEKGVSIHRLSVDRCRVRWVQSGAGEGYHGGRVGEDGLPNGSEVGGLSPFVGTVTLTGFSIFRGEHDDRSDLLPVDRYGRRMAGR